MSNNRHFPVKEAEQRFRHANELYRGASSKKERAKFSREVWEAIRDACFAYRDPENLSAENPEKFPANIATALYVFVGNAINKVHEESFDLLFTGRGASSHPVVAIEDLKVACMYIQWAKEKVIPDKTPIKTISRWFGVDRTTVHGWIESYDVRELLQKYFPNASDIERGKLLASVTEKSGARYREHGRGHAAVLLRDKKRKTQNKSAR